MSGDAMPKTLVILAAMVTFILVGALSSEAKAAPERIALVIANSRYPIPNDLQNPRVDAENVSRALSQNGYRIFPGRDLTRAGMLRALDAFAAEVRRLEPGSVALIYYAGHGYEVDGVNYLAPIDANFMLQEPATMVAMNAVLDTLGSDEGVAGLAFFDACRRLPPRRGGSNYGFVRSERHNTFVALSTELGMTASDGGAGMGSPFANALVQSLILPGLTPSQLMEMVRSNVAAATGGQTPVEYNNLIGSVTLNGSPSRMGRRVALAYYAYTHELYPESLELALPAARSGDLAAIRLMASLYFHGVEGVPRNEARALMWFRQAVDLGSLSDRLGWAMIAAFSSAASQTERDRAFTIIQDEARNGHPEALYALGYANLGRQGLGFSGFTPRPSEAVEAYRRAADAGHIGAAINFGLMLYNGEGGLRPDPELAGDYFFSAAMAGSPRGMVKYANIMSTYREGRRDPVRDGQALIWYQRAARWNEPEALARLSIAFAFGIGVERSRSQALVYIARALASATAEFRAGGTNIPQQIDAFARQLRSGRELAEPPCAPDLRRCGLDIGY